MRDMHCRDAGMDCDFVFRGDTDEEILEHAGRHGREAHNLNLSPELTEKIRGLIHDEDSEAHRRSSMGGMIP